MPSPRSLVARLAPCAVATLAVALVAGCAETGTPTADLALRNGKVATVDPENPRAEAIAMAGDSILAVGSDAEIGAYVGPDTRVIDLDGRLAVPGFVDSHAHFMSLGESLTRIDLATVSTWEEAVARVDSAVAAADTGEWILGRGWHQEKWEATPDPSVMGFPTRVGLDRVAPRNPVFLEHASGHAAIVNGRALERAGIGPDTESPEGGEIVRDARGRATGILLDNAERLVSRAREESRGDVTPAEDEERRRRYARLAQRDALSKGVTSIHDQGASFETIEFYRRLADEGALDVRLYAMVSEDVVGPENAGQLDAHRMVGHANHHLTVRAIGEISADGALGSHSAWFLQPYEDLSGSRGLSVTSPARIRELSRLGLAHDYQIATHAIGSRANRVVLDLYAALWDSAGVEGDTLRWRIEHAQHLHPADIPRFDAMGVIASMQAIHACSDAPYVVDRLGRERAREGAYVWGKLWESGALVTNGTDAPVEDIDPLASYHCTTTREMVGTDSTFFAGQVLDREEALRSYTLNGARSAFQEDVIGSIEPGKLADVVVLSRDILTIDEDSIAGTEVVNTIVGGEVVYSREGGYAEQGGEEGGG